MTVVLWLVWLLPAARLVRSWLEMRRLKRFELMLEEWMLLPSKGAQRAWLEHPRHKERCACGRYGLPFWDMIIDYDGDHTPGACWPARESLSR